MGEASLESGANIHCPNATDGGPAGGHRLFNTTKRNSVYVGVL